MKSIISCMLILIVTACNNSQTKPQPIAVADTEKQEKPRDTTKPDIILILGKAMNDLAYDLDTMKLTGDPDIDFSRIIRRHHRAGMDMSKAELEAGTDTTQKALARRIINREEKEVSELSDFLMDYQPQSKSGFGKRAKEMMHKKPGSGLPMHGAIMDDDFTSMMLLHHQEGVNLAKEYLTQGKSPQVTRVAEEIVKLQSQEIAELKKKEKQGVR